MAYDRNSAKLLVRSGHCSRPFVVVLVTAALMAAPWPDGAITGKDREIVARLTRVGTQRLDADAGHSPHDSVEHPVGSDAVATAAASAAAGPAKTTPVASPAEAWSPRRQTWLPAAPITPPPSPLAAAQSRLSGARAPPLA